MIRPWQPQDLEAIADVLLHLRAQSEWAQWPDLTVTKEEAAKWLLRCMTDYLYTAFVSVNEANVLLACVGVNLEDTKHPPHIRQLSEWCLWGEDKRSLVALWQEAKAWGRARGAILAQRGMVLDTKQYLTWEKLR